MTRRITVATVAFALAGCLDTESGQVLTISILPAEDGADFYATNEDRRTVLVTFTEDIDVGQTLNVTTTLGFVDIAANDDDNKRKSLDITTTDTASGEGALDFVLFAGWEAGVGEVSVSAPGTDLRDTEVFELLPLDDIVTLDVEPSQPLAGSVARVTVSLSSQTRRPRAIDLSVSQNHGTLSVAKVSVTPQESATVDWQVGAAGLATLSAQLVQGGKYGRRDVVIDPAIDDLSVAVAPGDYLADGQMQIPIIVSRTSSLANSEQVTVRTTSGILNPAASGDAARQITVGLRDGEVATLILRAGREPGPVAIAASISDRPPQTSTFDLAVAPPTLLGLALTSGDPVFDASRKDIDITVQLARDPGQGAPSLGTRVWYMTCCDTGNGSESCSDYLSAPRFGVTSQTQQDTLSMRLQLTATGETFVNEVGNPPDDDLSAQIHAYVFEPDFTGLAPTCTALEGGTAVGLTAVDLVPLTLRKTTPPPVP